MLGDFYIGQYDYGFCNCVIEAFNTLWATLLLTDAGNIWSSNAHRICHWALYRHLLHWAKGLWILTLYHISILLYIQPAQNPSNMLARNPRNRSTIEHLGVITCKAFNFDQWVTDILTEWITEQITPRGQHADLKSVVSQGFSIVSQSVLPPVQWMF